jgi:hypothetical protein
MGSVAANTRLEEGRKNICSLVGFSRPRPRILDHGLGEGPGDDAASDLQSVNKGAARIFESVRNYSHNSGCSASRTRVMAGHTGTWKVNSLESGWRACFMECRWRTVKSTVGFT